MPALSRSATCGAPSSGRSPARPVRPGSNGFNGTYGNRTSALKSEASPEFAKTRRRPRFATDSCRSSRPRRPDIASPSGEDCNAAKAPPRAAQVGLGLQKRNLHRQGTLRQRPTRDLQLLRATTVARQALHHRRIDRSSERRPKTGSRPPTCWTSTSQRDESSM